MCIRDRFVSIELKITQFPSGFCLKIYCILLSKEMLSEVPNRTVLIWHLSFQKKKKQLIMSYKVRNHSHNNARYGDYGRFPFQRRVRFFGMIRIRISDPGSLGSWYIKWTDESLSRVDSSVHLGCLPVTWANRWVHGVSKWFAKFRTGKFRPRIAFTICTNQF